MTIMPSMKNFGSQVTGGVKSTFGGVSTLVKGIMGAAATATAASFAKSALDSYASYEQMVGGVETLFKGSAGTVKAYAEQAYQTAGVSASKYMEQATAFSASLIQGLGGDTDKAAQYADRAIRDMSDNANKMGTSIESIQMTYQSLMRGNYAMLDNLKLGYGGTKSELQRLIRDSASYKDIQEQLGVTVDASSLSFDNIINAISVMQAHLGIAGTTALEAATTIEGSVNQMKSAWDDWVTALGRDDVDMSAMTDKLVQSVITAAGNVVPRAAVIGQTFVEAVGGAIVSYGPTLWGKVKLVLATAIAHGSQALSSLLAGFNIEFPAFQTGQVQVAFDELVAFVSDGVGQVVAKLQEIAPKVAVAAASFAAFKTVSSVGQVVAGLAPAISGATGAMGALAGSMSNWGFMTTAKGLLLSVQGALGALVSPVGIVIAAIAALAAGFVYFYTTNSEFAATINGIVSALGSMLAPIMTQIMATLQQFAAAVIPPIMAALQAMAPVIMQIITTVVSIAAALAPLVAMLVATVLPILTQIITAVVTFASQVLTAVMPVVQTILTTVQAAMPLIMTVITVALGVILGVFSAVWPAIQAVVTAVMGVIEGIMQTVWPAIEAVVSTVMGAIQTVITAIMQAISGDWEGAWDTIKGALDSAWEGIQNAVRAGIDTVVNFMSDLPGSIMSALGDLGSLLYNSGKSLLEGLGRGIQDAVGGVIDAVGGVVGRIRDLFPFSPAKVGPFSGHGYTTYSGRALMEDWGASMSKYGRSAVSAARRTATSVHDALGSAMTDITDPASWGTGPSLALAGAAPYGAYAEQPANVGQYTPDQLGQAVASALSDSGLSVYLDGRTLVGGIAPAMDRELGRTRRRGELSR